MRGRTNVGLYSGVAINANVEEKVVDSDIIAAGNFVEYTQNFETLDVAYPFGSLPLNYKENYIIIDGCRLIDTSNGGFELVNYFTSYGFSSFCILNDSIYGIIKSLYLQREVCKLNIVNNEIVFDKKIKIPEDVYYPTICSYNDKIVFIGDYKHNAISYFILDSELNILNNSYVSGGDYFSSSEEIKDSKQVQDKIFLCSTNKLFSFDLSDENVLSVVSKNTYGGTSYLGHDSYDVIYGRKSGSSSNYSIEVCMFNLISGQRSTLKTFSFRNNECSYTNLFANKYLIIYNNYNISNGFISLLKYDSNFKSIEVIQEIQTTYDINGSYGYGLITNDGLCLIPEDENAIYHLYSISEENPILTGKVVKGRVKNFAGVGNPIGVAKQNGSRGNIIEVYIPNV